MHLLAFDTSTDTLSIAVQRPAADGGPACLWQRSAPGGAHASAGLLPAIRELLSEAGLSFDTLDAIVFGRGPGSFTGLRTACAVAQGLAFGARGGAGVPVLPVDTLLAVAEEARAAHGCTQVVAVLDARMDEVYAARYAWHAEGGWQAADGDTFGLCAPEAVQVPEGHAVAGNARAAYGERLAPGAPAAAHVAALPTAAALLRLAPALLAAGQAVPAEGALPRYVRDKVAQTTAERAAAREAASIAGNPSSATGAGASPQP
ncbi:tRNA (adenosine(37)-N6)-threonylcarbamoyltransferase complex dimerization subunit type 1 TsaB [Paracidovorax citrulli]|uniref:Peptidase M22, glycoprotease n=2 Tax=Paracidovorax citrulli TaxID=80869 RepID=A1TVW8_PARC0|nr:tRNA (adenosine(37)-N6)-threonylcarbamoyltransferase complex dimerization subunit type 1 TsaB [Paracidovorax citrulli]ABM35106.1 peptidase M22, glycoprotease [Paracidovorax citrulli AAC00-1]ATG96373.1 tRNA (adenosine(37)-N6)-threonylcarbamoyltransferase complex dimerization subunit type 1 TsaB [Paracidovorax citrulli]PVY64556.1 tRNA threonylcarbamoyladenosine biosynthesis protein TsaB [Paracidovorax citrulli]QCX10457.1 tRNA threonylcarbamoyladenosine biosynthesis protein TsaB [Paracidovorax 